MNHAKHCPVPCSNHLASSPSLTMRACPQPVAKKFVKKVVKKPVAKSNIKKAPIKKKVVKKVARRMPRLEARTADELTSCVFYAAL